MGKVYTPKQVAVIKQKPNLTVDEACLVAGIGRGMREIVVSGALAFFLLASSPVAPARADDIPPCPLPDGVVATSLENAPTPLLQALKERIGELVPPGGRFDSTDVVRIGKNRRLIFIWNAGKRWIVATEYGGIGYNDPIFAYDLGQMRF
jgi:hypothetical protein